MYMSEHTYEHVGAHLYILQLVNAGNCHLGHQLVQKWGFVCYLNISNLVCMYRHNIIFHNNFQNYVPVQVFIPVHVLS